MIYIHGSRMTAGEMTPVLNYYLQHGYVESEVYATTYSVGGLQDQPDTSMKCVFAKEVGSRLTKKAIHNGRAPRFASSSRLLPHTPTARRSELSPIHVVLLRRVRYERLNRIKWELRLFDWIGCAESEKKFESLIC